MNGWRLNIISHTSLKFKVKGQDLWSQKYKKKTNSLDEVSLNKSNTYLFIGQHFIEQQIHCKQTVRVLQEFLPHPLLVADLPQCMFSVFTQPDTLHPTFILCRCRPENKQLKLKELIFFGNTCYNGPYGIVNKMCHCHHQVIQIMN